MIAGAREDPIGAPSYGGALLSRRLKGNRGCHTARNWLRSARPVPGVGPGGNPKEGKLDDSQQAAQPGGRNARHLARRLAVDRPVRRTIPAKPIHPGVMTFTAGAQCTSNFIFRDGGGTYIGQAAHCSGTGGATETNGCDSASLPIGTPVEVDGATRPGTLVYNSWITMQALGETNADACQYNDFALVKLDPADVGRVDPSIPGWGGPTALGPSSAMLGDTVYSYGNSSLRGGDDQAGPEAGRRRAGRGQRLEPHRLHAHARASPVTRAARSSTDRAEAIGVLSTLQIAPVAGSNGVADLRSALRLHARATARSRALTLVPGTKPLRRELRQRDPQQLARAGYGSAGCSVGVPSSIEGASTVSSLNTNTNTATIARPRARPRTIPSSRSPRPHATRLSDPVEQAPVGPERRLGRGNERVRVGVARPPRRSARGPRRRARRRGSRGRRSRPSRRRRVNP